MNSLKSNLKISCPEFQWATWVILRDSDGNRQGWLHKSTGGEVAVQNPVLGSVPSYDMSCACATGQYSSSRAMLSTFDQYTLMTFRGPDRDSPSVMSSHFIVLDAHLVRSFVGRTITNGSVSAGSSHR